MKAILITADKCEPCTELEKQFANLITEGEIEQIRFETQPDKVIELMDKYPVGIPSLLILSDSGELIISI